MKKRNQKNWQKNLPEKCSNRVEARNMFDHEFKIERKNRKQKPNEVVASIK